MRGDREHPGVGGTRPGQAGGRLRRTSEADARPLAPRDSAEDTDPEGSEPQSTRHLATRGPRRHPGGIRVGAPGRPPCPGNPLPPLQGRIPTLPNGLLCHSPHKLQGGGCSSRQMATPRLRPAHPDPTREATPWGEAPPPLGKGRLRQDHPETNAHPTQEEHHPTSTPLQRGPAEGRSPTSR